MALDMLSNDSNVTIATLSVEFERGTISHDVPNDSSLYVTEQGIYPFWVSLSASSRFLLLQSYVNFVSGLSQADWLEFCNRINERQYMPPFHVSRVESNDETEQCRLLDLLRK